MGLAHRFGVCNEIFRALDFGESCSAISEIGYSGIEIAPFTLAENPVRLSDEDRSQIRRTIARNQLEFIGLHWLLVSPKGLHATTPDKTLRRQTWDFIGALIDLCRDLRTQPGATSVMVFGSPQQRSASGTVTSAEATEVLVEELARIAPRAENSGVQLLLEPLSRSQTNVVTSLAEAVQIVESIGSPAVQTMFDVHNAVDEALPHSELLRHYMPHIRHVHVNEMDGREPGSGNVDFQTLLSTLSALAYTGWVSLEVFDFSRDARAVASGALSYLKGLASASSLQEI